MKNKKFLISISALMLTQAFMYWFLKLFQSNPYYINSVIDSKIPFIGYFIYIYNMFYPVVFLSFYYLFKKDEENYFKGIISGIIGFLFCDLIFLLFPTIMNRPTVFEYDYLTNLVLKITYYFDTPALNCFPSIHCLFCFQVIFSFLLGNNIDKKKKILIILINLLIVISTVLVKQHYFYDIIMALFICIFSNIIVYKFNLYNKIKQYIK